MRGGLVAPPTVALFEVAAPRTGDQSREGRNLWRFFLISVCLVALMVTATVFAIDGHLRSQGRYQAALAARADAGRAQSASIVFWREREAINEYLLHPHPSLLVEVQAHHRAFDLAMTPAAKSPLAETGALESAAQDANEAFLAAFQKDRTRGGPATLADLRALDQLGRSVVGPVEALVRIDLDRVRTSERQASTAARWARIGMISGGLVLLVLLATFILYVLRLVRDLRRQAQRSRYSALHDPLTDLPNRALFRDRVEHEILRCSRDPAPFSLLIFDLDRFKEINDTLGHSMGDLMLQEIGPRVAASLRAGDTLARLGGDEFGVLLPSANSAKAAEIAERVLEALRQPFALPVMSPRMSASVGIVTYPTHGDTGEALIQHADVALDLAKEHRNSAATYDHARDPYNPARLALASHLDRAIADDEFELHYQPKIDTRTLELVSVEALLRWQHPERGLLYPGEFIALAEHTGLIKPLTLLVLRKAICQAREWEAEGQPLAVSVNLSAANLLDTDLVRDVTSILESEGVSTSLLELEITETTIMTDPDQALTVLRELDALGIRLSIDDFGTGYSSLAYLRRLPVQEIKIDRAFIQNLAHDRADATIVQSTIKLAHSLGFTVVAEGVEDQLALDLLASYGCDRVQGFFLCRPQPAALFDQAVRRFYPQARTLASAV